jgi:hypothetical protein
MRRLSLFLAAATLMASAAFAGTDVKVPPFSAITATSGVDVTLIYGPSPRVTVIQGDISKARIEVRDGHTLEISGCNGLCVFHKTLKVEVVAPRIDGVVAHSGADVAARGNFPKVPNLHVTAHSGGDVDAFAIPADTVDVNANSGGDAKVTALVSLNANANSGGDITYRGHPPHANIKTSSGGDINGE